MRERPWRELSEPGGSQVNSNEDQSRENRPENRSKDERIAELAQETGLTPLAIRVCLARGLNESREILDFISPRLDQLKDPSLIKDMDKAVERFSRARELHQCVRVFGDYDVDGTTGSALLSWFLRDCGVGFDVRQPDRFKDGYGLNVGAVEAAVAEGVQLLITVDCGITSFAALNRAGELGLEVIVVDHHQVDVEKGLPPALAILNPQRADCQSGLRELCGCGLAFYFARALRTHGRNQGWWPPGQEPNLKKHLDLVVMATAADMVPLVRDNHILVKQGMEVLKNSTKPGVRALLESAGLTRKEISPGHLGFVLGPRINASGRLGSASLALELLTTTDESLALAQAQQLERLNQERAEIQNAIWDEVRQRVEAGIQSGIYKNAIVVGDSSWHEGVVGIVASRVTETFRKPAAVIALREDYGKGSVRSYGGKNVLEGLRRCAEVLRSFGGHHHAAGLSVELHQFEAFVASFDRAFEQVASAESAAPLPLMIDGDLQFAEVSVKALEEIERLGPFGPGNPEPVFRISAEVVDYRVIKERHLKLTLVESESKSSVEGIWFGGAEREDLFSGSTLRFQARELAIVPELNRFRGRVTPTFRVRDIHWNQSDE